MNFSQNYFERVLKPILSKSGLFILGEIKRYADYCRLEERIENARVVNADKAYKEGLKELKSMAKEDGII